MALNVRRIARVSAYIILPIVLLDFWYVLATAYDYGDLAGTYVLNQNGDKCTLRLRSDRTFKEELTRSGKVQTAEGTWRRIGEGGVAFSKEFLNLASEERNASGESYGWFSKELGLFTTLALAPQAGGPTLRKKLFE